MVEPPELSHSTLATLYLRLLLPERLPRRAYPFGMMPPTLIEEPGSAYEPMRWDAVSEPGPPVATNRLYAPLAARRIGRVAYLCKILHTHTGCG